MILSVSTNDAGGFGSDSKDEDDDYDEMMMMKVEYNPLSLCP